MSVFSSAVAAVLASMVITAATTADARDIWPPPAKYDHGPLMNPQYPVAIIHHLAPAALIQACQGKHLACSYADIGSPCEIFLPMTGWQGMVRHEMGHCRGWPANHKG